MSRESHSFIGESALPEIKVAIIEDRREIREGLAMLIDGTDGYACVGAFPTMEDAIAGIHHHLPQVALVDIGLPGMSGIEGIGILREHHPELALLMLSVYDDDDRIFKALCAGACGYLLKKTPPARLLESISEVISGGAPMSPAVARKVIYLFREFRPPEQSEYHLTPHETKLLRMLVEGYNYKAVAAELGVSINTVSFHMRRIYEKLQVHSKSEAVSKALRQRLI